MKKLSLVVPWCALMTLGTLSALAQDTTSSPEASAAGAPRSQAPSNASVSAQADAQTDSCGPKDSLHLVYPLVDASYVGGTIPNMPMKKRPSIPLKWAVPFILPQYRANGKITALPGCLLFRFKPSKKKLPTEISGNKYQYQVLPCNSPSEFLSSQAKKACTDHNKKAADSYVIQIPYRSINVLSRAKYPTAELTSISTAYAAAGGAVLTALLGAVHNTHAKELAGGITAGSLVLYYYSFVAKPLREDNYIAVFVCKEVQQSCEKQPAASQSSANQSGSKIGLVNINQAPPAKPSSDELFAQGDVITFRIPNKHDYYNISMILNGETGKTFVSETAEKTGK